MSKSPKFECTIPNVLTLIRFALIPVFIMYMLKDNMNIALIVFVSASLTDLLDGYIARKFNCISDFGKLMDPLADKMMVVSLMILMGIKNIAPMSAIIILLTKEVLMVVGGIFLLKKYVVVHSKPIGKAAQFTIVVALVISFFHSYFNSIGFPLHTILLWLGVALSVIAFVYYAKINVLPALKNNNKER